MIIGLWNSECSPQALQAQIPLVVPIDFDHGISVNTYSTLAATASALAMATVSSFNTNDQAALLPTIDKTAQAIEGWQKRINLMRLGLRPNPLTTFWRGVPV